MNAPSTMITALLCSQLAIGCGGSTATPQPGSDEAPAIAPSPGTQPRFQLLADRAGFTTGFAQPNRHKVPPDAPPAELFELVHYPGPLGDYAAYITPEREGERRAAIVWIHGGFDFSIGRLAWEPAPRKNDQSASAFREAGLVLMLPGLRGTNDNPGDKECFLGEVDDLLAAVEYLRARPDVDPDRIYLGGHSTGGTLALLAAASTDRFRAVFSFGPVLDVQHYGDYSCLPDNASEAEARLRRPLPYLADRTAPTFIIEGARGNGPYNIPPAARGTAPLEVLIIPDADHFSVLRPGSEYVAGKILEDRGATPSIELSAAAIARRLDGDPANSR